MDKKHKFMLLDIIGIFFLFLGIIAIANSIHDQNPTQILYLCYLSLILIGIGILTKRSFIIMSQVYILAIPLLIWDIDFLYWLIFSKPLWGITDYFFINNLFNIGKIISLQHLFTVPLAIYSASLIGVKRKDAWIWSFIQIILIFIAVNMFSPPELNVNCVFNSCINVYFWLPYNLIWFLIIFSMTFITSVILNYLPIIKVKNDKKTKR
ncbi:MAG: hypothetical protein V1491_01855 [archaeon]